jgi:hypothetical protein
VPLSITPGAGRANARKEDLNSAHLGGELQTDLCNTGDHGSCLGCDCTCHPRQARDWARRSL